MEDAQLEQLLHDHGNPADPVQVAHHEAPGGANVHQVRHAPADRVEVVELELHVRLARDREQMQDRVRRARERHRDRDRVLEGLPRHDLPGPEIELQETRDGDPALAGGNLAPVVDGGRARRAGQRHPQGLAHRGHRVRRVHARARPSGRARRTLQAEELRVAHLSFRVRPNGFEDILDRDVASPIRARQDRAAVEVDRRQIHPSHRHQHARLGLVAARDPDERVQPLRVHHQLDGVGDQIARHQRCLHPFVTHRDAVGDRDRRELERDAAALAHAFLRERRQLIEVVVARGHLVPRRGDPDLGATPVGVAHPHRPEHGPGRGPLHPLGDVLAARLDLGRTVRLGHDGKRRPPPRPGRHWVGAPVRRRW